MKAGIESDVYQQFRQQLLSGQLKPGFHLSEPLLARQLGVSRTPVRNAIRRLQSEGLVERVPNAGAFVRAHTDDDVEEAFDLRAYLEGYAVERAVRRISATQLQRVAGWCDRLEEHIQQVESKGEQDLDETLIQNIVLADTSFHREIIKAAGGLQLAKIISDLSIFTLTFPYRPVLNRLAEVLTEALGYHRRIWQAMRDQNAAGARDLMIEHINVGKANYFRIARHVDGHSTAVWSDDMQQTLRRQAQMDD